MNTKEYYYIDFIDLDIYSWVDENSEFDMANKLIGNKFDTLRAAREALEKIINKNQIA